MGIAKRRLHQEGRAIVLVVSALLVAACGSSSDDSAATGSGGKGNGAAGSGAHPGSAGTTNTGVSGSTGVGGSNSGSAGSGGIAGSATAGSNQGGSAGAGTAGYSGVAGTQSMGGSSGGVPNGGAGGGGTSGGGAAGSSGSGGAPQIKKFAGNITTGGQVRSDFGMYWDQITPENEGKWGSVEGTKDQMNWSGLDRVHDYAKQHNIPFKQHNFVWGAQQPGWIAGLSQADQRTQVEEWIRLFCQRYPDTQLIDVVNEPPPHTTPPYTAALGGAGASGYDWIAQAFKWAHQYCPNAILIINDYNTIEYGNDNSHIIDIVNKIKAAGAPINAVGAQAHAAFSLSTTTVQGYIDKIATSTGLPVYISEYDINLADDTQQKNVMQSQFTMFWNDANVKGVTVWGYIVGQTWETNTGLMTSSGQMRPAMTWLMQFLNR